MSGPRTQALLVCWVCLQSRGPNGLEWAASSLQLHQIVFPASGYVIIAIKALKSLTSNDNVKFIEVQDLVTGRAIAFNDEFSRIETLISLKLGTSQHPTSVPLVADFECYSCPNLRILCHLKLVAEF